MKLSQEEQDKLRKHFEENQYDPSKAPEQQTADFTEKAACGHIEGLCGGGCVGDGYANGGYVPQLDAEALGQLDAMEAPPTQPNMGLTPPPNDAGSFDVDAGATTTRTSGAPMSFVPSAAAAELPPKMPFNPMRMVGAPKPPIVAPGASQTPPPPLWQGPPAPANLPQAQPKLTPDQFSEMDAALRPGLGSRIGNGLAGLADSIVTGVGGAPSSGFMANRQAQRQQLIEGLKAKYEAGLGQRRVATEEGRLAEDTTQHGKENAINQARLAEEKRAHDLEAGQRAGTLGVAQSTAEREAAQKVIEAYEKGSLLSPNRPSSADYQAAKQVLLGAAGIAGGKVHTATNPKTGQKVISKDGGKTWQKL